MSWWVHWLYFQERLIFSLSNSVFAKVNRETTAGNLTAGHVAVSRVTSPCCGRVPVHTPVGHAGSYPSFADLADCMAQTRVRQTTSVWYRLPPGPPGPAPEGPAAAPHSSETAAGATDLLRADFEWWMCKDGMQICKQTINSAFIQQNKTNHWRIAI